jgi:hypothetical protein
VFESPKFCPSCGNALEDAPAFCPSCGSALRKSPVPKDPEPTKSTGIFKRYWNRSVKGRIFYGAWVFLNVSNGINLIVSASAPKDRFRNVCEWEGVNCPPSAEEQALQSFLNLILWNVLFWTFRYFYKKRQARNNFKKQI